MQEFENINNSNTTTNTNSNTAIVNMPHHHESNNHSYTSNKSSHAKSKRIRTTFTPEQLKILEQEFSMQMYLVGSHRQFLADSLGLTESQVKVWFQNRRIKQRKTALANHKPEHNNNNNHHHHHHHHHHTDYIH